VPPPPRCGAVNRAGDFPIIRKLSSLVERMPARRARLVGFGSILQIGTSNLSFTLDTAAPAVPIIGSITDNVGLTQGPLANGDQTDDPTLTLTGTAETGATIKVFNGATQLGAATAGSGGS